MTGLLGPGLAFLNADRDSLEWAPQIQALAATMQLRP